MTLRMTAISGLSICFVIKERCRQTWEGRLLELFPRCVDSLLSAVTPDDNIQVIVADYGSNDWPLHEWLPGRIEKTGIQLELIQMTGDFSRGKGLNHAAARSIHNLLFFLDVDVLITRDLLAAAVTHVSDGKVFAPIAQDLNDYGEIVGTRGCGYGCLAVSKKGFEEAGGWPEFRSWGGEDTILFSKLQGMMPVHRSTYPGFLHQWHPEGAWKDRFYLRPADADYFEYMSRIRNDAALSK